MQLTHLLFTAFPLPDHILDPLNFVPLLFHLFPDIPIAPIQQMAPRLDPPIIVTGLRPGNL
jgi:hypothetical protein